VELISALIEAALPVTLKNLKVMVMRDLVFDIRVSTNVMKADNCFPSAISFLLCFKGRPLFPYPGDGSIRILKFTPPRPSLRRLPVPT
jgi:hypothetical protein